MPLILLGNFHFWREKKDQFGPFYAILAYFGSLTTIWTGTLSKMTGNFKIILSKALLSDKNWGVQIKIHDEPGTQYKACEKLWWNDETRSL